MLHSLVLTVLALRLWLLLPLHTSLTDFSFGIPCVQLAAERSAAAAAAAKEQALAPQDDHQVRQSWAGLNWLPLPTGLRCRYFLVVAFAVLPRP